MTPALEYLTRCKVAHRVHKFNHDTGSSASFGTEAADKLAVESARIYKTLVVKGSSQRHAVVIVPVPKQASLKAVAKAMNEKKVTLANSSDIPRITGYLVGGVSPLAQKNLLPTYLDASATQFKTIFVSAGQRGLEIELCPHELARLCSAAFISLCV